MDLMMMKDCRAKGTETASLFRFNRCRIKNSYFLLILMFYFTQIGTIISQYMPPTHFQEAQWVIFTVYADVRVS
jgi:hypothetical protein